MTDELLITGAAEEPPQGDDFENPTAPRTHKPTDDEIGDDLIERWKGSYRWFYSQWHHYKNGVWEPVPRFEVLVWDYLKELKAVGIRPNAGRVANVEKYLQAYLWADEYQVDSELKYINLRNGLFNVDTLKLEPHTQEVFFTSQLPFDYDEDAGCPTMHQFLRTALVQPGTEIEDAELRDLVWEALGYSLTADTGKRVSFWLQGESNTGKSVLINLIQALAGDSHTTIDLTSMASNTYQLADVAGKRIVTFTEPRANSVLADDHYKRLVSQDAIQARQIFGKPFTFVPICKVWGAMNELPRIVDRSDAIFNRVILIPMNRVIPLDKRDPELTDKLRNELSGIFNHAITGLLRLRRRGKFTVSQQSENARAAYKQENDVEAAFVDDWCIRDTEARIDAQTLYDAYASWCKRNGAYAKSKIKVGRDWERLGFHRIKSSSIWYQGVKLNILGKKAFQ